MLFRRDESEQRYLSISANFLYHYNQHDFFNINWFIFDEKNVSLLFGRILIKFEKDSMHFETDSSKFDTITIVIFSQFYLILIHLI